MTGACRYLKPFRHWHQGIEIIFVHSGAAELFYGMWRRQLLPGDIVIAPTEMQHGAKGHFQRTAIHLVPDILPSRHHYLLDKVLDSNQGLHLILNPDAVSRFTWATTELYRMSMHNRAQLATVQAILGLLVADMESSLDQPDDCSSTRLAKEIAAYMRLNMGSLETVDSVAKRFGFSRSQLWELFRTYMGTSPGNYWRRLRLEHARHLLAEGMSLPDVCEAVGFQSLRGFRRAFRQEFGLSPSEYQRLASLRNDSSTPART